jgi:hypothetical protein
MTTTTFVDKVTVVEATWLNDVDEKTYGTYMPELFTGTGAQLIFNLAITPLARVQVAISGVLQQRGSYTLVGPTLTFSEAPPFGTSIEVTV